MLALIINKMKIFSLVLVVLYISGCFSQSAESVSIFTYPLINECKDYVMTGLEEEVQKGRQIEYKMDLFSKTLPHSPEIVGSFTIVSDVLGYAEIENIANRNILGCYPTGSSQVSLNKESSKNEILTIVKLYTEKKIKTYFSIEDDNIKIFHANPSLRRENRRNGQKSESSR